MLNKLESKVTATIGKAILWHEELKQKLFSEMSASRGYGGDQISQRSPRKAALLQVPARVPWLEFSVLLFFIAGMLFPEVSFAAGGGGGSSSISAITDLKTLSKTVQSDIQGYAIPIVLNAAGIGCAGFALISQRWTMLILGAAYLIFVNVFFGFVNGKFQIS